MQYESQSNTPDRPQGRAAARQAAARVMTPRFDIRLQVWLLDQAVDLRGPSQVRGRIALLYRV